MPTSAEVCRAHGENFKPFAEQSQAPRIGRASATYFGAQIGRHRSLLEQASADHMPIICRHTADARPTLYSSVDARQMPTRRRGMVSADYLPIICRISGRRTLAVQASPCTRRRFQGLREDGARHVQATCGLSQPAHHQFRPVKLCSMFCRTVVHQL